MSVKKLDERPGERPDDGYAVSADLAGLPIAELVHLLALAAVAAADLAMFYNVVSIVMQQLTATLAWLTVVGFTAASLMLAHFAGRMIRDRKAGHGDVGRLPIAVLLIAWLSLGALALLVRLTAAAPTGANSYLPGAADEQSTQIVGAFMFLVLYVASGAVAGFGEYFTRNPYRGRYRKALRGHNRASKRLSRSQPAYQRSFNTLRVHEEQRDREDVNYRAAIDLRKATAQWLKKKANLMIAAHLQDPSATDGLTRPDAAPAPQSPSPTATI
ncbi:hypothetical protein [Labedaea rhizosphaerae]|uniref:Uncharacterized protein n=1 Tax=Labedaea rhizosphaerae TaxID=598644 RepID=A0A4R6S097_LABRH|nr:hypothetical protein EV186_107154 [Labedaea rhizosphaerae]